MLTYNKALQDLHACNTSNRPCVSAVVIGLSSSVYEAVEGEGSITVCVIVFGGKIEREFYFTLATMDITAIAGGKITHLVFTI